MVAIATSGTPVECVQVTVEDTPVFHPNQQLTILRYGNIQLILP
jgi:hypothetical protein